MRQHRGRRRVARWAGAALGTVLLGAAPSRAAEPPAKDPLVEEVLAGAGAVTKSVLASPETYRFQVLYGVVEEGAAPSLVRHGYRADAEYFFPASSMKVPITLAAYERLAALRTDEPAIERDATMKIFAANGKGDPYATSLARETWRALIVSDNASANRLLAFVGHREANETLWGLGLRSVRIHTGFATGAPDADPPEISPRIDFRGPNGDASLAPRKSTLRLPRTDAVGLGIGKAYLDNGRRIPKPLGFADKNAIRLVELQDALVRIVRPDLLGLAPDGAADDLAYVKSALGTLPSESGLAGYDRNVVADYPLVPFLRGIERVRARGHFQIFSKVGQAFGFLIANAYIVDKDTGRSFFLTASIFANPDEVMNDDIYAYDTISFPVMADLGELFCRHAFANANMSAR